MGHVEVSIVLLSSFTLVSYLILDMYYCQKAASLDSPFLKKGLSPLSLNDKLCHSRIPDQWPWQ
eukprot:scaffold7176_cov134-Cylindrotheca_fusiformis.AAC.2